MKPKSLIKYIIIISLTLCVSMLAWFTLGDSLLKLFDLLPLALVFATSIVGIFGKSWDEKLSGMRRLTPKGYILIAFAIIGLSMGIRNYFSAQERSQVIKLLCDRYLADSRMALNQILFPLTSSMRDLPKSNEEIFKIIKSETFINRVSNTRIVHYTDPSNNIMYMTSDPRFFEVSPVGSKVISQCGIPHEGFRDLYQLFDFSVGAGCESLNDIKNNPLVINYRPELSAKIQEILSDDYFNNYYQKISRHQGYIIAGLISEGGIDLSQQDVASKVLDEISKDLFPSDSKAVEEKVDRLILKFYYFPDKTSENGYKLFINKIESLVGYLQKAANDSGPVSITNFR